jgi:hypothetical protein
MDSKRRIQKIFNNAYQVPVGTIAERRVSKTEEAVKDLLTAPLDLRRTYAILSLRTVASLVDNHSIDSKYLYRHHEQ